MQMSRSLGVVLGLAVLTTAAASYATHRSSETGALPGSIAEVPRRIVDIDARDYAFDLPDTLAPGPVTFRFTNLGPDLHHVYIVTLPEGKTLTDIVRETRGELLPDWAVSIGGPGAQIPSGQGETSLNLTPGRYAVVCIIPAADGVPHLNKGMMRQIVVAGGAVPASLPTPDIVMTLHDYRFELSAPLTAGRHVIEVKNVAPQHHEVIFVKLAPGKKIGDLFAWLGNHDGPPPAAMIGGTSPFSPGVTNLVDITLEPGNYALVCFATDVGDGKFHVEHGMSQEFTIGG
jgi:hypothetical protein